MSLACWDFPEMRALVRTIFGSLAWASSCTQSQNSLCPTKGNRCALLLCSVTLPLKPVGASWPCSPTASLKLAGTYSAQKAYAVHTP